ncbi:hypothetical protein AOC10_09830 [Polynucleobacter asymbioticus]|jgi:hypothetical protein|nr:hypothetical protein AOC10_09830 [Polynucleobacter asymbioticus]
MIKGILKSIRVSRGLWHLYKIEISLTTPSRLRIKDDLHLDMNFNITLLICLNRIFSLRFKFLLLFTRVLKKFRVIAFSIYRMLSALDIYDYGLHKLFEKCGGRQLIRMKVR